MTQCRRPALSPPNPNIAPFVQASTGYSPWPHPKERVEFVAGSVAMGVGAPLPTGCGGYRKVGVPSFKG